MVRASGEKERSLACITVASATLSLRASSARSGKLMVVSPMWKDSACAGPAAGSKRRGAAARVATEQGWVGGAGGGGAGPHPVLWRASSAPA